MFVEDDDADDESDEQRGESDVRADGVDERDGDGSRGCACGNNGISHVVCVHQFKACECARRGPSFGGFDDPLGLRWFDLLQSLQCHRSSIG